MDDETLKAEKIAQQLAAIAGGGMPGGEQLDVFRTIAKTVQAASKRLFNCPRCNRKFHVSSAKSGRLYKCVSCQTVLAEIPEENIQTVDSRQAEFILDEAIPRDVITALQNHENIFGKFVLVKKLGEGAMGEVFRAFDVELSRYAALKFIKSRQVEELKAEARILASLEHKNIARIYEIGSAKGRGFIAMQFVQGSVISGQGSTEEVLLRMVAVCEGVDYAHKQGLVHRDIKPYNIMVDLEGNVFVMDFGLAIKNPVEGEVAGTPGYMAPEIARGAKATPASDVYSLSATFYHLLTGTPPLEFSETESLKSALAKISSGTVIPIRQRIPEINRELEAILEKGLDPEPQKRYADAGDLRADIDNYLRGLPVAAYGSGFFYRLRKRFARNKKLAAAIAAISVVAISAAVFGIMKQQQQKETEESRQKERTAKEQALADAERKKQEVVQILRDTIKKAMAKILEKRREKHSDLNTLNVISEALKDVIEDAYSKAIRAAPDLPEPPYLIGRMRRATLDWHGALKFQEAALEIDANYAPALYEYSIINSRLYFDQYMRAKQAATVVATAKIAGPDSGVQPVAFEKYSEPTDEEIFAMFPELRRSRNDILGSITALEKSLSDKKFDFMSPGTLEAARGIMYGWKGSNKEAKDLLIAAMEKDASLEEVYETLTRVSDSTEEKESWATKGIEHDFGFQPYWTIRGTTRGVRATEIGRSGQDPLPMFKLAEEDFATAIKINPKSYDAWLGKAEVLRGIGVTLLARGEDPVPSFDAAENIWKESIPLTTEPSECYMKLARICLQRGQFRMTHGVSPDADFEKIEKYLAEAIRCAPTSPYILLQRCAYFYEKACLKRETGKGWKEDFDLAEQDADRAIKLNPNLAEAWNWKGSVSYGRIVGMVKFGKDPKEEVAAALQNLALALKKKPALAEAWMATGHVHLTYGTYLNRNKLDATAEWESALAAYSEALKLNPNDEAVLISRAGVTNNLTIARELRGEDPGEGYADAESDYDHAIKLNPADAKAWLKRGNLRFNRGIYQMSKGKDPTEEWLKAADDYGRVLEINKNDDEILFSRSGLYTNLGVFALNSGKDPSEHYQNAIRDIEAILTRNRENPDALFRIGFVRCNFGVYLDSKGKLKEALKHFTAALEELESAFALNPALKNQPGNSPDSIRAKIEEIKGKLKGN